MTTSAPHLQLCDPLPEAPSGNPPRDLVQTVPAPSVHTFSVDPATRELVGMHGRRTGRLERRLAAFSDYLDAQQGERAAEAISWGRVAKVAEEAGEVVAAYIGATGQNPRKGRTHDTDDVIAECLDVAVTALGTIAHLAPGTGVLQALYARIDYVADRAGLAPDPANPDLDPEPQAA